MRYCLEKFVMPHRVITLASILIALVSLSLWAAEKHSGHTPGMSHGTATNSGGQPQEGGQATFAALVEIVAMLEQDTETDWDTVDIDGLRAHLLDMNHLILDTEATTSILGDGQIQFDIRGTEKSIPSIHRMNTHDHCRRRRRVEPAQCLGFLRLYVARFASPSSSLSNGGWKLALSHTMIMLTKASIAPCQSS